MKPDFAQFVSVVTLDAVEVFDCLDSYRDNTGAVVPDNNETCPCIIRETIEIIKHPHKLTSADR